MAEKLTPERQNELDGLAKLRSSLTLKSHPDVTVAFDIAKEKLLEVSKGALPERAALEITRQIFRAVMDADFMIMHREEIEDTILVAAQIKKVLEPPAPDDVAKLREALEKIDDLSRKFDDEREHGWDAVANLGRIARAALGSQGGAT